MPLPAGISLSTVTGTFINVDGSAASGRVVFVPNVDALRDAADNVIMIPSQTVVNLDDDGSFSVVLPATDDADWSPIDWTYTVSVYVSCHGPFAMVTSLPTGPVDLADVAEPAVVE